MYLYIFIYIYIMNNNIRLKIRDLVRRGGSKRAGHQLKMNLQKLDATSAADKLGGNMANQAKEDQELVDMNKTLAGGAVVVPQMNQAGESGNDSIKQQIGSALQGNADGQYDTQVMDATLLLRQKSTVGGRRRRKTRRKRKKRKEKAKRRENQEENQKKTQKK